MGEAQRGKDQGAGRGQTRDKASASEVCIVFPPFPLDEQIQEFRGRILGRRSESRWMSVVRTGVEAR